MELDIPGTGKNMSTSTTETGFFKPKEKNVDGLPVRLILCFDGTGDTMQGSFSAMRGESQTITHLVLPRFLLVMADKKI
jgi:hypothetical protein